MTFCEADKRGLVCRDGQNTLVIATVGEVTTAAPGLKDIPIARDIPGVSPFELMMMMMPPVREIEFAIDVVLGTAPISIAPHWIPPVKLRELRAQSLDLMDRGSV